MLGLVAPPGDLGRMARDVADYLLGLGLRLDERLVVWISSEDSDLLRVARTDLAVFRSEIDTQPVHRYRHVYGVDGLYGRNLNFGIRTDSGRVDQIGNLIVIEWQGVPRAVEFGISIPMLLSLCHDKPHPLCATPIAEYLPPATPTDIWLADALATAEILVQEGLRPRKHGRNRTVRTAMWRVAELLPTSSFQIDGISRALGSLSADRGGFADDMSGQMAAYVLRSVEYMANRSAGRPDTGIPLSQIL
ncbi:hypothetical protein ABZ814_29010 [Micromonospora musae]|uniref:hypothetical protein n=1 Tax=Micromonospora musae TaxID=1894970 RepID=UPI0033D9FDB1